MGIFSKILAKIPKSEYLFNFYAKIPKWEYSVRNSYKFSEMGIFVLPIFCQQKNRLLLEVQKLLASTCFCFVFILYAKTHYGFGLLLLLVLKRCSFFL